MTIAPWMITAVGMQPYPSQSSDQGAVQCTASVVDNDND